MGGNIVSSAAPTLQFDWSIWDNRPAVAWTYDGKASTVTLRKPPLSVANLPDHSLVAVIGDYDDLGSANLLLYSYDGVLRQTLVAPELGSKAHFGSVSETHGGVSAVVGFFDKTGWVERAGKLNLKDGTLVQLHRSY
jgi:hypothetical protein